MRISTEYLTSPAIEAMDESAGSLAGWYLCNHVMVEICSPRFERRQRESGLFLARYGMLASFQLGTACWEMVAKCCAAMLCSMLMYGVGLKVILFSLSLHISIAQ